MILPEDEFSIVQVALPNGEIIPLKEYIHRVTGPLLEQIRQAKAALPPHSTVLGVFDKRTPPEPAGAEEV